MDNRDMFYNSYGYSSGFPINPIFQPNGMFPNQPYHITDLETRLNKIENQINKLNQRIIRLESPNNNNIYSEPDNNLYML